jgi:macrolide-specific efflux system membrane fusion protein
VTTTTCTSKTTTPTKGATTKFAKGTIATPAKSVTVTICTSKTSTPAKGAAQSTGSARASSTASGAPGAAGSSSGSGASSSGSGAALSCSTGSAGTGSSAFITLINVSGMQLVVPLSESSIGKVKVGQPAEVTVQALPSEKLAAHVTKISLLPSSNSPVVRATR